jgi:hypothetical protein
MSVKQRVLGQLKKQRYGLLAMGLVLTIGIVVGALVMPTKQAQAEAKTCPAGTYQIGWDRDDPTNPTCKNEPTGCPFGDSVPMDKCTPPPDLECNADWSECHPKTMNPVTQQPAVNAIAQTQAAPQQNTGTCASK